MSKAKVVQLSSVHKTFDTRIFYKISKSLVRNGYDVDLIIQHHRDEIVDGVSIKALPKAKRKVERITKVLPALIRKCRNYPRETIFHFHDSELIPVGLYLKLKGYKVIYDVHEDVPKDLLTKHWIHSSLRSIASRFILLLEGFVSKKFDAILTVVPSLTERFISANVYEIRNYPVASSVQLATTENRSKNKKYVIYIGDLTTRRGIPNMVDAIIKVDRSIEFYLGGTFSEHGLKEKLKKAKGWHRTKHLGWVDQEDLPQLLQNAVAGMLTLNDIPTHRDSFPVKLFEYMLAGIPVIASDFPLWRKIIKDANCGILVNPDNSEEIADGIEWILNHPEEAEKMGQNGIKAIKQRYNWAEEEKKLIKLYKHLSQ